MYDSFPEPKIQHLIDGMDDGLSLLGRSSRGNIDHMAYWLPTDFMNLLQRCDRFTQSILF